MNIRAGLREYILQTHNTKFYWRFNGGGLNPSNPPLGTPLWQNSAVTCTDGDKLRGPGDAVVERPDMRRNSQTTSQGVAPPTRCRQRPGTTSNETTKRRVWPTPAADPRRFGRDFGGGGCGSGSGGGRPNAEAAVANPDAEAGHWLHRVHDERARPVSRRRTFLWNLHDSLIAVVVSSKTGTMGTMASQAEIGVWVQAPAALLRRWGSISHPRKKYWYCNCKIPHWNAFWRS